MFAQKPARSLMIRLMAFAIMTLGMGVCTTSSAQAQSRIKDLVEVEGVRDNTLIGYGLVAGLNGTGDSLTNAPFTEQSLVGMLERLGVNTRGATMKTQNVAAVMVTASLPPFAGQGTRIDVTVGAMGDAKSLLGGVLLVTPLLGADGEVYAVSQGTIIAGGFTASGQGATVTRGVPTSGRISAGAVVEREIPFALGDLSVVRLNLHNPDFTTSVRVAQAINMLLGPGAAEASDPASVSVTVPANRRASVVGLITEIEQLRVTPDETAKVVIDEQSGVIVMGENVRISTVAIAQGNLTIRITEMPQVSQPGPFSSGGTTTVVPRTDIQVDEGSNHKLAVLPTSVTLQDLVQGLNALGVGPRDMITILQSIKAAGALQAEIQVL